MNPEGRPGDWVQTTTGRQFWILDPRPEDVCLYDIAHSHAAVPHFNGHSRPLISIAEHTLHVASLLPPRLKLPGLLHDSEEPYIGDILKPLKRSMPPSMRQWFKSRAEDIRRVVFEAFNIPWPSEEDWARIKEADNKSCLLYTSPSPRDPE